MYKFPVKCIAAAFATLFAGSAAIAQTSSGYSNPTSGRENNPYSKYGIGELWNGNGTALKGMGSITSAYGDPFTINPDNPASYSWLAATTFQGGAVASYRNITNAAGASYTASTASLGYLNIGFPLSNKKGGLSLGVRPYSRTYYALVDTTLTPLGGTIRSYSGDGGLNYGYLGGAYRIKDLSIGFNLGYMFGNYRNFTSVNDTFPTRQAYIAQFANYNNTGGLYWKGGLLYSHTMHDTGLTLNVGATFALGQNLNQRVSYYQVAIYNFGDTIVNDTSAASGERKGKLTMPLSASFGIMLSNTDRWKAGLDFAMNSWSNYKSTGDTAMNLGVGSSSYKLSLGGELTPNSQDITSYFSRVTYRAGLYYGKDYIYLQQTNLPVYGVTLGASLPYKRTVRTSSKLHLSMDIGRLGTHTNNLMQQTYVRFGLGLTFNQTRWGIPVKYD